jgi:hypothetical protein
MKKINFFFALLLNIATVSSFAQETITENNAGLLHNQTNNLYFGVSSAENLPDKNNGTKSIMEDWETGDMSSFPWTTGGDVGFFVSTTNPYEGNYCAESGNINDSQTSSLIVTLETFGDNIISFYRKVSSESSYDYLRFYIDGSQKDAWSGEKSWQKCTYFVTEGTHKFEWIYTKDGSVSNGSDCAWIDNISFPIGLQSPNNLNASFDFATTTTSLIWDYDEAKDFQYFNIYRNDIVINTTTDTVYSDTLTSYGEYEYKISAVYNQGESDFSNTETILYSMIEIDKEELNYGLIVIGNTSSQQFTISNIGSTLLYGTITTPAGFAVGEAKNSLNFSIPASSSKIFNLTFTPTLDQDYTGDVVISHNGGGPDRIINVTGEGTILVQLPYTESFETDFGDWEQSTDDDSDWTRNSGTTPSSYTGPSSAFDGDYYIYTEASNMYPDKEFGLKESFDFSSIIKPYITFWYNMYGSTMGTLKVQISLDGTSWIDIWSLSGNQGSSWQKANIDLGVFAGQNIVTIKFLGITGSGSYSDMAIDYVYVFDNLDRPTNLVAQLNSMTSITNLTWDFEPSKSFQYFNIYRDDMLIGTTTDTIYIDTLTAFGTYEYKVSAVHTEGESPFSNVQTINHSPVTPTDLSGSLNNTTSEVVLNWKFETSKAFQNFNIYRNDVLIATSTDTTFSEILTSFGTYSYKVTALWEEGESGYSNTKTLVHSAIVPTDLIAVFDSVTAKVDLSWVFDNSKAFQHFNIYRNDILIEVSTTTSFVDILPDFGVYEYKITSLYNEGESGYSNIETVIYTSIGVSPAILDYGASTVGKSYSKKIVIRNIGNTTLIGGITTPEGFSVVNGKNTLTYLIPAMSTDSFDVVFSPAAQQLYSGNIVITHNAAGPEKIIAVSGEGFEAYTLPYEESFESGFANWMFSDDDDYDWTRQSGSTPTVNTGPFAAYDGEYYLYTESYHLYSNFGLEAVFSFENIAYPAISFWYHMYGNDMGTLKVQASIDGGNNWSDVWSLSGNQGNQWYQAEVNLTTYTNQEMVFIRFLGHTSSGQTSDMAIDMIELYNNLYAPENLASNFDAVTGQVDLIWNYSEINKGFQYFNVYRNSVIIGTTTDTVFSDVLSTFGNYCYKVTAIYTEGESKATNTETINYFASPPNNLISNLNESNGEVALNWKPSGLVIGYKIYEDFEDGIANNWNLDDPRFSVTDGHLVMNGNSDNTWATTYFDQTFEDYTLEFEFIRQQSSYTKNSSIGAFIRSNGGIENGNGYLINFTSSGIYSVWKITNGYSSNIIPWTGSNYINTVLGASNVVTIIANGFAFDIYVNGNYLTGFYDYDHDYISGHIALSTYDTDDGDNEVWFDNIFVTDNNKQSCMQSTNTLNSFVEKENSSNNNDPGFSTLKELNNPYVEPKGILSGNFNSKTKSFQSYNIYRNETLIGITTDTTYTDTLTTLGEYDYKVTAMYNEGESSSSNVETVIYSAIIINVDSLDFGVVQIGENKTMSITITNIGSTILTGTITPPSYYSVDTSKNTLNYTVAPDSSSKFNITFTPITIQDYNGNIVITHNSFGNDKVVFVNGKGVNILSVPYSESFESDFGGWLQSTDDDYDWSRNSGSTPSSSTGPSSAYDGNYYLYTEASDPAFPNKVFGLEGTFSFVNTAYPMMTFWYNMYGVAMGTLKVQVSNDVGLSWTDVWTKSGNQGNIWQEAQIDLSTYGNEENVIIRFLGITGNNYTSDMAIDLIELYNDLDAPYNLTATIIDPLVGEVSLGWNFDGGKAFQNFNIYRNDVLIGSNVSSNYTDFLPAYGSYDYYVKAQYTDGESNSSNIVPVTWEYTNFAITPNMLTAELASGDSTNQVLTISDMGGTGLDFTISIEYLSKSSGDWLSVNPESGTIASNNSADVDVKFDALGLDPGTYLSNIIVSNSEKAQVTVPVTLTVLHPISVNALAFLEGPFFSGQMNNLLKIYDFIPLAQPYNTTPWYYAGTESVAEIPNNNVVDWVLMEVRETSGDASTATSGTVIGRRAGFILKDGSIVDTDGSSPLTFSTVASKNVFAVLYHRNHIPIMSANPLSLSGTVYSVDFSTSATQVYRGASACKELTSGIWGLFSGNAYHDGQVDNKDKNDIWEIEKGNAGYFNGDMNMNGQVDDTDKQIFWESNAGKSCKVPE